MRHHGRINEESEIRVDCKNLQQVAIRHAPYVERDDRGARFGWKAATRYKTYKTKKFIPDAYPHTYHATNRVTTCTPRGRTRCDRLWS